MLSLTPAAFITDIISPLRYLDSTAVTVTTTSFITYLIFHYYEPQRPLYLAILLVLIPVVPALCLRPLVSSFFLAVPVSFLSHNALILLFAVAYRLSSLHPLAKYPGPIPSKISKLWMSYITFTGKQHIYYRRLHQRYGDIVRIGPNELSINHADAIQPIFGSAGLPRGPYWSNRVPEGSVSSLLTQRDPVEHQRRRKPWARAFSSAALKNYEEIILKRSRQLVEQLEKRKDQVIDLNMWMGFFAFDFMGDMVFGADFDMMHDGYDAKGIWHIIENGMVITSTLAHVPWAFRLLHLIPGSAVPRERMISLALELVSHRVKQGSKVKDLFYYLIDEEGFEPIKPSLPVVYSDGILAVIAGSDTTATTFSALWYYLLCDSSTFKLLRAEIDQYFPRSGEPDDFLKMACMPYLNACINEALRLLPPVLSGTQRTTNPGSGGKLVGSYFIPEGNNIFVHTYSLHRDPRYFSPLPDSFWPDRWLPECDRRSAPSPSEFIHNLMAFQPFSFGPANCVGKNLALQELRALVCFMVQRFDFTLGEGCELESWEDNIEDYFVMKRPPIPVVLQVRQ